MEHTITELHSNEAGDRFKLLICDAMPEVVAGTKGTACLTGTEEQFHELYMAIERAFDFDEDKEEA